MKLIFIFLFLISFFIGNKFGWAEPLVAGSQKDMLFQKAKDWAAENIKSDLISKSSEDEAGNKTYYSKVSVEDNDFIFFNLTSDPVTQFVLSATGPTVNGTAGFHGSSVCEQKFILFTFKNEKITGNVIYEATSEDGCTGYNKAVKIINFPEHKAVLLLNIDDQNCGSKGHIFEDVRGRIKEVLVFDKNHEPCSASDMSEGGGFDTVLEPQNNGDLKVKERTYQMVPGDEESVPSNYINSEITYHFDISRECFIQLVNK